MDRRGEEVHLKEFVHFASLPNEILSHILRFVKNSDLFKLRETSKRMKYLADDKIKKRKSHLIFGGWTAVFEKEEVKFLCSYYTEISKLSLTLSVIDFRQIIDHYSKNVTNVEYLEVASVSHCSNSNVYSIVNCFQNLKTLKLGKMYLTDNSISKLFRGLPLLEYIVFDKLHVTGKCFKDMAKNVKSIDWTVSEEVEVDSDLMFANGSTVEKFYFEVCSQDLIFGANIAKTIERDLPNLAVLHLCSDQLIYDFGAVYLPKLQEYEVHAFDAINSITAIKEYKHLTKLYLDIQLLDETRLVGLLQMFPNIETFHFSKPFEFEVNQQLIDTLANMKRLNRFYYRDFGYELIEYLMIEDGSSHSLIKLLESLTSVKYFSIYLNNMFTCQDYTELQEAIEDLRIERPDVIFDTNFDDEL